MENKACTPNTNDTFSFSPAFRAAFRKLSRMWKSSNYSVMTKVHLYNSLVKSVLLYSCETWKMNEGNARKLDTFQFTCMTRIIKIQWPYVICNEDLVRRTETKSVSAEVKTRRWKWIGHVSTTYGETGIADCSCNMAT